MYMNNKSVSINIRKASQEDIESLAWLHVTVWESTYRDMVPQEFFVSYQDRLIFWSQLLEKNTQQVQYVAYAENGHLVGFISLGVDVASKMIPGYDAKLFGIYVLKEYQGKGIGKNLLKAGIHWLKEQGLRSLFLWVLENNSITRRVYEALGAYNLNKYEPVLINGKALAKDGTIILKVAYGWDHID